MWFYDTKNWLGNQIFKIFLKTNHNGFRIDCCFLLESTSCWVSFMELHNFGHTIIGVDGIFQIKSWQQTKNVPGVTNNQNKEKGSASEAVLILFTGQHNSSFSKFSFWYHYIAIWKCTWFVICELFNTCFHEKRISNFHDFFSLFMCSSSKQLVNNS